MRAKKYYINTNLLPFNRACIIIPIIVLLLYSQIWTLKSSDKATLTLRPDFRAGTWFAARTSKHGQLRPCLEALEVPARLSFAEGIFLPCAPVFSTCPGEFHVTEPRHQ